MKCNLFLILIGAKIILLTLAQRRLMFPINHLFGLAPLRGNTALTTNRGKQRRSRRKLAGPGILPLPKCARAFGARQPAFLPMSLLLLPFAFQIIYNDFARKLIYIALSIGMVRNTAGNHFLSFLKRLHFIP